MPAGPNDRNPAHDRAAGHAALVVVQLCFGLFPIFGTWAFAPGGFAPSAVAGWRVAVGAVVLLGLALWRHGRGVVPRRSDLGRLALCSLLGVALNQALFLGGLARSTAMNAGLIMCLIPVFTFVVAASVRQESFSWARAAGVAVACAGTVPLFTGRGAELFDEHALGNLLMVLNVFSYSLYLVLSKTLTRRYPPLVLATWVYVLSLPALVLFFGVADPLPADRGSALAWRALAYIVVAPTVVGYLLNLFALARVRASTTAIYVYLQPLVTAAASVALLDEQLTPGTLRALGALFVGIALVTRRPPASPALADHVPDADPRRS